MEYALVKKIYKYDTLTNVLNRILISEYVSEIEINDLEFIRYFYYKLYKSDCSDKSLLAFLFNILNKYLPILELLEIDYRKILDEFGDGAVADSNKILMDYDKNFVTLILPRTNKLDFYKLIYDLKRFGLTFNRNKKMPRWEGSFYSANKLNEFLNSPILNKFGIEFTTGKSEYDLFFYVNRITANKEKNFELSSVKKIDNEIIIPDFKGNLYPFQKVPIEYFKDKKSMLIGDDMGTGKTASVLATIQYYNLYPVIVVCPAFLKLNWKHEINKFLGDRKLQIINGLSDTICSGNDFILINYDIISKYVDIIKKMKFKCIVLDESHYIKNSQSQMAKAVNKLKKIEYKILLSGTPILNHPMELTNQLNFLGVLNSDFGGLNNFINSYAPREWNGYACTFGIANEEQLQVELRKSCMIRRSKDDVLKELPPIRENTIYLPLDDYVKYKEKEAEVGAWFQSNIVGNIKLTDAQIKLLRNKRNREVEIKAIAKIEHLRQETLKLKYNSVKKWIDNTLEKEEKIVLFAHHRFILDKLKEDYLDMAVCVKGGMSDKIVLLANEFNTDKNKRLFLGSIRACGVGINLISARILAFIELWWNAGVNDQVRSRIHRIGQTRNVDIDYLIADDTIESYIYDIVMNKKESVDKIMDMGSLLEYFGKK